MASQMCPLYNRLLIITVLIITRLYCSIIAYNSIEMLVIGVEKSWQILTVFIHESFTHYFKQAMYIV